MVVNERMRAEAAVMQAAYRLKSLMVEAGYTPGSIGRAKAILIAACLELPNPEAMGDEMEERNGKA